jgi:hypothetical protein
MSTALGEARKRRAGWIVIAAVAASVVAATSVGVQLRQSDSAEAIGPVLPQFAVQSTQATSIRVVSKDATYVIEKGPRGWTLKDRGGFPVKEERINAFANALGQLVYVRPMTRDKDKLERLGLGDPATGGSGTLVEVSGPGGALLADLILSVQPNGAVFLRRTQDSQSWAARGELPALGNPAAWLELTPFSIDRQRVARVDVAPVTGPAFSIARDSADAGYALMAPHAEKPVIAPTGLSAAANGLARLQPVDVEQSGAISGAAIARVALRTFDGLRIDAEIVPYRNKPWVKLIARAERPEAQAEADTINKSAAAWAFALSDIDARDVAPALSTLVRMPEPEAEPEAADPKAKKKK